jgi:adenylate kinase family enzyme
MRRVSVVGNSSSGKSTLASELADILDVPYVELDAEFHQPGWQELPRDQFRDRVRSLVDGDGWVVDGNYSAVREIVWDRADAVVFLDLPRRTVMRSVVLRSARRVVRRTELWNGNRETVGNVVARDSIVVWAWTQHDKYRRRYRAAMTDPRWAHLEFVRLTSRPAARAWLAEQRASRARRGQP